MKTLVIAEAGVNHNGDYQIARQLVDVAAEAGANYVKFQTFKAEKLVSREAKTADYQLINTGHSFSTQFEMLKKLELPEHWHMDLMDHAVKKGISFLSTAFDEASADFLMTLGISLFKIPSGEITNKPFLQHIAGKGMPVILSTGMSTLNEIADAIDIMVAAGQNKKLMTILHCNTEYPTPMADVNLMAMKTIANTFDLPVGYSDHTLGIEIPIAAVALGAVVIEKHFTLDRNLPGPDHKASLEPAELGSMIRAIRHIESALGSGIKEPSPSEMKNISVARKSIHLATALAAGTVLAKDHLIMKRPGDGISPMMIDKITGRTVRIGLPAGHKLTPGDLI